uniref:Putative secreted protein n=1 Tax=Amblyomma parvum TaxID=251391 RepID=A0A023G0A0_AMBPA
MHALLVSALLFTTCAAVYFSDEEEHGMKICGSNGNASECEELCSETLDEGPCRALIPRWGFMEAHARNSITEAARATIIASLREMNA